MLSCKKGLFSNDQKQKEDCYKQADRFFNIALSFSPHNHIILSNRAMFFLEKAEEEQNSALKQKYYTEAEKILKPLVEKNDKHRAETYLYYAVAVSNLASNEQAEPYMKKARIMSDGDIRLRPHIDDCLLKKDKYKLPAVDSNRTIRKNHPEIITTPYKSSDFVKVVFSPQNVAATRIETERTVIRPIRLDDRMFIWEKLYGNLITMSQYHDRKPRNFEKVVENVDLWCGLFRENQPYSAYIVESKNHPNERLGLIAIEARKEHDAEPGLGQLFYLFSPEYWGNAYGKEDVTAFVEKFVKIHLMHNPQFPIQGKLFEEFEASALQGNAASNKILDQLTETTVINEKKTL